MAAAPPSIYTDVATGNVGIGTTAAAGRLTVAGGLAVGAAYSNVAPPTNGAIFAGSVGIGRGDANYIIDINNQTNLGTVAGNRADLLRLASPCGNIDNLLINIDNLLIYNKRHTNGSDWTGTQWILQRLVDETYMSYISFGPNGDNLGLSIGTNNVERIRISNSGNIGIGTTNPSRNLHAELTGYSCFMLKSIYAGQQYGIEYYNGNIFGGINDNTVYLGYADRRWVYVAAVNGVIQTSDEKDKDFVALPYGLAEVQQIDTIKYKWKTQKDLPDSDPTKNYEYYGFKAGNLKTIFPELVYDETETLQLNYAELMPVLVNAIKEQQTLIQSLQARVAALETAAA